MKGKEIYKIYAPEGTEWTQWVRPVLFVSIDLYNREPISDWIDRKALFLKQYHNNTIIFVDLPGKESIELGIDLARIGYRPIPIFNGVDEQQGAYATTNTHIIESCLINGSEKLKKIKLNKDANPAFLLDSYRTNRYRIKESIFDNSWDLYAQDIPSVEYFQNKGIEKIIIISNEVQQDLRKIFFKFQELGMNFYLTDGYKPIKKIKIKKRIIEKFEKEEI